MMPNRRWFQFSLRSCLALTMVACLGLGWHVETKRRRNEASRAIEAMGGEVNEFDPTGADTCYVMFVQNAVQNPDGTVTMPPGDEEGLFAFGPKVTLTDDGLKHIASLRNVDFLAIERIPITDDGLKRLCRAKSLRSIHLYWTRVTDAGVAALQRALPKCEIDRFPEDAKTARAK